MVQTIVKVASSNVSNSTQRFLIQPNVFQLRNLGEARYLGTDFRVRTSLTNALQIWANCTYLSRRNRAMPKIIMLDTPRHKVYSTVVYSPHRRLTAFTDFMYEGGGSVANDGSRMLRADSFGAAGIGAAELQSGIRNLFDRNYICVPGYPKAGSN